MRVRGPSGVALPRVPEDRENGPFERTRKGVVPYPSPVMGPYPKGSVRMRNDRETALVGGLGI